jgi:hypothetical protein
MLKMATRLYRFCDEFSPATRAARKAQFEAASAPQPQTPPVPEPPTTTEQKQQKPHKDLVADFLARYTVRRNCEREAEEMAEGGGPVKVLLFTNKADAQHTRSVIWRQTPSAKGTWTVECPFFMNHKKTGLSGRRHAGDRAESGREKQGPGARCCCRSMPALRRRPSL